jgi:hypothetical protein
MSEVRVQDLIMEWMNDSVDWKGYENSPVIVVGIRGYYLRFFGDPERNDRGYYDDAGFILSPTCFASFNFNTDPAVHRSGTAALVAPQVVLYKPGYHGYNSKWGHPAFRQASPVVVWRDGNVGHGKKLSDGSFTDKGGNYFWTNLHSGGLTRTSSLGCQTVYKPQWASFYELLRDQLREHISPRAKEQVFPYLLLEDGRIN